MQDSVPKKEKKRLVFIEDILNYLEEHPSGSTITDIADGIGSSRITVGKYIAVIIERGKIFSEKIGGHKLYFSSKRNFLPKKVVVSYLAGLWTSLRKEITNKEKFKEFGRTIADYLIFPYGSQYPIDDEFTEYNINKKFLIYLGKALPYFSLVHDKKMNIDIKINQSGDKAIYILSNIDLFEISEDFDIQFYIEMGIIEKLASKRLNKQVLCNIEKIDLSNKSIEFSVEIR